MKTLRYLFVFLLIRLTEGEQKIDCEESKLHAVYYATRCCFVTLPKKDAEFMKCHAKFSKMAHRPATNLTSPERIAINICAHECTFLNNGFIRAKYPDEFDLDVIEDYYLDRYANVQVFSTYMIDAFRKCLKFDTAGEVNIKYPKVSFIHQKCDPLAARIMMCIRTKAMQSCPPDAWDGSSFDCAASKMYFKDCVGSIEKVVRAMR